MCCNVHLVWVKHPGASWRTQSHSHPASIYPSPGTVQSPPQSWGRPGGWSACWFGAEAGLCGRTGGRSRRISGLYNNTPIKWLTKVSYLTITILGTASKTKSSFSKKLGFLEVSILAILIYLPLYKNLFWWNRSCSSFKMGSLWQHSGQSLSLTPNINKSLLFLKL